MKTYGSAILLPADGYQKARWRIAAEPHVMLRLKNVMHRVDAMKVGEAFLQDSPETCRDLEWFVSRYPLDVTPLDAMQAGAASYRKTLEELEQIRTPDFKPREFALALPARHYQSVAAELLLARGSQLLADQVGLGKSVSALAALTDPRTRPAVVVCQAHLPTQWFGYCAKFAPAMKVHIIKVGKLYNLPPADVYVCTYHRLAKWAQVLSKVAKAVVFDEAQELRHSGSAKYNAAVGVRAACQFAMGLSATPIFNYGGEIWSVLEVLDPGGLGSRHEFEREWCSTSFGHATLKEPAAFGAHLRDKNLMVRRTRTEVGMELPPVQTIVETIEHDSKVLLDLDTLATELAHRVLSEATSFHEKGEAARELDIKLRQATGLSKAPFVAAFCKMLLDMDDSESVVISGWHRECYSVWNTMLHSYGVSWYTGSESTNQKQKAVADFIAGRNRVMLMSLRSGSGLDGLQEKCSTIVHGELDWSPQVHHQITGRLARDGQTDPVFEYYLVSDAGSDPVIADVLGIKKAQSDALLGLSGITQQADDVARVKKLAQEYLALRRHKVVKDA